ncbi:hypothetical protein ACT3OH_05395 [Vreelandella zhanjiangensis]|uniref:hypothetical protein n=1 Tax=Vreelandella zhanjiangensis TaxID=1121960 RepID=UPI00402A9C26
MSAICLVDTSVFLEILNVPGKASQHSEIFDQLSELVEHTRDELFLPMATILETGNHIGQNGDGRQRRHCAEVFTKYVSSALEGRSPFKPISFMEQKELQTWLDEFPDHAGRGSGLGDLSIFHDWQRLCIQNPRRRVYIWSLDQHLSGFDQPAS